MTDDGTPPVEKLKRLIDGFRVSQAIHVAAKLGIADLLANGSKSADELARATNTHPESVVRLMSALAAEGIFEEGAERTFSLTPCGDLLRSDSPQSLAPWAIFIGGDSQWQGWGNLEHSIRTGESGTTKALGMSSWEYRKQNPEVTAVFDRAMTSISRTTADAVVGAYNFGRFARVADIGGGHGMLLAAIVKRFPSVHGILFDQPHVIAGSQSLLGAEGVTDRIEVAPGSFFDDAIPAADVYILQHIVHDWSNPESVAILKNVRASARSGSRTLIIERLLGGPNEMSSAKFSDLNMLVGLGVGRERTVDQFERLLRDAGFEPIGVHPAGTHHIIEGVVN